MKILIVYLVIVATGEPALCMAVVAIMALRNALNSARIDSGLNEWYNLGKYLTAFSTLHILSVSFKTNRIGVYTGCYIFYDGK